MKIVVEKIKFTTSGPIEITEITDKVSDVLSRSGITEGFVNVMTQHTTMAIILNEKEPGLQGDMVAFLSEFVPRGAGYTHDKNAADGRSNTHSHLMTMFLNSSTSIPVSSGKMVIGRWQSIFFVELDGPRDEREVVIQIIGE